MGASIATVLLGILLGSAGIASVVGIAGNIVDNRRARKEEYERTHAPWDPALCIHNWETFDAGTCENTYSSYGGSVELQNWKVEGCTHCRKKIFSCSDSMCPSYDDCRTAHEVGTIEPGKIERTLLDRVADNHGLEYTHYQLRDRFGNRREAWCRTIPTTIPFSCPDCGGMVVGTDAHRVWPGTAGPEPSAYRCEQCGREEDHEFGVPRVVDREGDPSFAEPEGVQPVCPHGGKHEWEVIDEWSETDFPEGIDACLENMSFIEEVWYKRLRCTKCGEEKVVRDR